MKELFVLLISLMTFNLVAQEFINVCPPSVGQKIPSAMVSDVNNISFDISQRVEGKPTVLIIYRGGWCAYCNRHLADLLKIEESLVGLGYQILAVSPDRPDKIREHAEGKGLKYDLVSDSDVDFISAMGLAFTVGNATLERYARTGIDLEDASGMDHHILPVPALFLLDEKGVIQFTHVNPNYRERVSAEVVLAVAKAYAIKSDRK